LLTIPVSSINWTPCYRIIGSRYPAINFFEKVAADPSDWELLLEVERMTDPSVNVGNLSALELEDRLAGPGFGRIMSSFAFHDPTGTRFTNGDFGAYYAALDLKTAIAETIHHRVIFMKATNEPAQDLDQLLILADVNGNFHDIRDMQAALPAVYDPTSYNESQRLAVDLRTSGSLGIIYKSVRLATGECVAVWRARVLSNPRENRHITYRWDGNKFTGYYDKHNYQALP